MNIKVGVLFGGKSVEHEVSIISALQACQFFDQDKYDILPIYMTKENTFYIGEEIGRIESYRDGIPALLAKSQQVRCVGEKGRLLLERVPAKRFGSSILDRVDVVFPIVHGTNVEDGALQGFLKTLGVPFVGCDVLASAVGMDKYVMKMIWKDNGLPELP